MAISCNGTYHDINLTPVPGAALAAFASVNLLRSWVIWFSVIFGYQQAAFAAALF